MNEEMWREIVEAQTAYEHAERIARVCEEEVSVARQSVHEAQIRLHEAWHAARRAASEEAQSGVPHKGTDS